MTKLIQTALNRPVSVFMFYLGFIILGALSLHELPVELFPPLDFPEITVHTIYEDALPEDVEQNITSVLEEAISAGGSLREIRSQSMYGESFIKARFDWGTDMRYAALSIRQQIDRVLDYLPQDAQRPVVLQNSPQNAPFLTLALSGNSEKELARFGEYIVKRRMEQIKGIAYASILGAPEREIYVEYDPVKLKAEGFTTKAIQNALYENNISFNAGSIKKGHFRLALRIQSEFESLDDMAETLVFPQKGNPVPLKKIARVYEGTKVRQSLTRINGMPCIAVDLHKETKGNTVLISEQAQIVINQLKEEFPQITFTIVSDQAQFVRQAVNGIILAILIGGFLAFIILFFFLKSKTAPFIIGVSIPVSIIITFVIMKFGGISLNIISLAGLALGSGMLVDNAIIILENIQRLREQGVPFKGAALKGAAEVAMPITGSTLTTLAVFLPVIFLKDLSGVIFGQQALTASVALLASLFSGLTLLPVLYVFFNRKDKIQPQKTGPAKNGAIVQPAGMNKIEEKYHGFLKFLLKHRNKSLALTALSLIIALLLLAFLNKNILPDTDQKAVNIDMKFLPGVSIEFIDQQVALWEKYVGKTVQADLHYARLGKKTGVFTNPEERRLNRASILVKGLGVPSESVIRKLKAFENKGLKIQYDIFKEQTALTQLLGRASFNIDLNISGENLSVLDSLTRLFISKFNNYEDGLVNGTNFFERYPALMVEVDRDKLIRHNLSARDVSSAFTQILKGVKATEYRDFDKKIKITYRANPQYRFDLDKTLNTTLGENRYKLGAFVHITQVDQLSSIDRQNQTRVSKLSLSSNTLSSTEIVNIINDVIEKTGIPAGYRVSIGGQWQETTRSINLLLLAFGLSIILVYLILAAQFESFKIPLVIMFTVPLAFIGVVPMLVLTGQSLNIMSAIGFVVVIGIVVNDGIIKIDFIERLRREGKPVIEAILEAGKIRLRPIIMTTVTTVLGLLPLALGFGPGAGLQQPMAIAVIGGISVATVLTLFVLPLIYLSFNRKAVSN
jgi:hydrophobic/amphiphilic exporter-1 (mainly G- bacteria), HAE1 family